MNTKMLSPETLYGAYLVCKAGAAGFYGFEDQSIHASVRIAGGETEERIVFLDAERGRRLRYQIVPRRYRTGIFSRARFVEVPVPVPGPAENEMFEKYPKEREDGWLEIELGEFFNKGGEDKEVEMGVHEITSGDWKGGLVVQGIEIRPKHTP